MRLSVVIALAIGLIAFGAAGGAAVVFKLNASRIERLTEQRDSVAKERDEAVRVSEQTAQASLDLMASQKRVTDALADLQRMVDEDRAEEQLISSHIRDAPPGDNGPVPKIVTDTIGELYATRGGPE